MLRSTVIAFAISLLSGSVPALAAQSCSDWCLQNRCGHGAMNPQRCLQNCVPACEQKHPNGK